MAATTNETMSGSDCTARTYLRGRMDRRVAGGRAGLRRVVRSGRSRRAAQGDFGAPLGAIPVVRSERFRRGAQGYFGEGGSGASAVFLKPKLPVRPASVRISAIRPGGMSRSS